MTTAKDVATEGATVAAVDETGASPTALADIEAAFSDIPEDATITLYRRQKDTGKWGHLETYAPDAFSIKNVADSWGGGIYNALATARVKGKPGRPRIANVQFTVDPDVHRHKGNGGAPAAAGRTNMADILEASYAQALQSMMQTMQATAQAASRPPIDWAGFATAAVPLVVAILERGRGTDPLETAAKLVELTRPEGKAPEFSTLFDVFTRGLDFQTEKEPDSLGRIAESVTNLIERTKGTESEEAQKMLKPGDTMVPPAPPATGPPWLDVLRPHLGYLLKQGAAGKSPRLYAEWLVDQLPAEALPVINDLVADPAYPENVVSVLPVQVQHLAPWLRTLCLEVAGILEEPGPANLAPEPSSDSSPGFARPPLHPDAAPSPEEEYAEDDD